MNEFVTWYNREPFHVFKIIIKREHLGNWACCLCRCLIKCIVLPAAWVKSMHILNLQLNNRGRLQCATSAIGGIEIQVIQVKPQKQFIFM